MRDNNTNTMDEQKPKNQLETSENVGIQNLATDKALETSPLTSDTELKETQKDDDRSSTKHMTSQQKFTLISLSITYMFESAFFSMLGPFFPQEASKKGASQTMIGLIFGVFQIIIFVTSPFFGLWLTKVGAKFMFVAGLFVSGGCNVLFGFLDKSPDGWVYVALCFAVRLIEGLGSSANATASFAILAYTFPDQVSTMIGILETFSGLGMMAGPVIGGSLYQGYTEACYGFGLMVGPVFGGVLFQAGGFLLPFGVSGGLIMLVAVLCLWLLPSPQNLEGIQGSMLPLFKMPITFIVYYIIFAGSVLIGFLDVSYSLHLKPFNLSPLLVGLAFLVGPAVYAIGAPFLGCILDKKGWCKSSMALGGMLCLVSYSLMGPVPFLSLPKESLGLNIGSSVVMGLGFGCLLVPPLQELLIAAFNGGFPDNLETYGITSGLYTSAFSIGAFVGSIGGGGLVDKVGFQWAAFIMGLLGASCTLFLALFVIARTFFCKPMEEPSGESKPLIR